MNPAYPLALRRIQAVRSPWMAGWVAIVAACGAPPPGAPVPANELARMDRSLRSATRLQDTHRIMFDWSAREEGSRFGGRGVARVQPPHHVRLDLFLSGGETVARAALVGDDSRIPRGLTPALVPRPELLWAVFGVFRPAAGGPIGGDRLDGEERVRLRYASAGGEEIQYELRNGTILQVEVLREGNVIERVEIEPDRPGSDRYPAKATYRNLPAFLELTITKESVEHAPRFPPEIWNPHR